MVSSCFLTSDRIPIESTLRVAIYRTPNVFYAISKLYGLHVIQVDERRRRRASAVRSPQSLLAEMRMSNDTHTHTSAAPRFSVSFTRVACRR